MRLYSVMTFLGIVLAYLFVDQPVALWCHDHVKAPWETLFQSLTVLGVSTGWLVGSLAIALGLRLWHRYEMIQTRAWFVFTAVAVSGLATDVIKWIAGRFRPRMLFENQAYGFDFFHIKHTMTSFPSGHTTTAFALAMVVMFLYPRWRWVAWSLALGVAISRIAITAHFVSDTLAGAWIGIASTLWLYERYFKKSVLR